jgi:anti-anti-sigma factor
MMLPSSLLPAKQPGRDYRMTNVDVVEDGSVVTIIASGELALSNVQEFGDELRNAAASADIVIVDLRPAVFIDSAVVNYLVIAERILRSRGKRLKVKVAEGSYPLRVLGIVGFDQLMDIEAEPPEAGGDCHEQ